MRTRLQEHRPPVRGATPAGARRGALLGRAVLAVLALAVALITAVAPAQAHTDLDSTTPENGASLDAPVDEITLTFTLPVTRLGEGVTLQGPDGQVPLELSSARDGVVWEAVPQEPLVDGTYTTEWTVAAQDGHPLDGSFTFTVAAVDAPAGADDAAATSEAPAGATDTSEGSQAEEPHDEGSAAAGSDAASGGTSAGFAEVIARLGSAAALWGALVAAGGLVFSAAVLRGSDREDVALVARVVRWCAGLILVGLVVRVMARAVLISQGDLAAAVSPSAIADSLGGTTRWVLGLQAAGALVVLLGVSARLSRLWVPAMGLLAIGAGHVLAGHSNTVEPRWIVLLADVSHLLAAAVWVGGVVIVGVVLRHRRRHNRPLDAAVIGARFSVVAAGSVVVVGVAGVVLALTILDRPAQLWETSWGLLLVAKVAVVAVVGALGAYNHFRVVPALAPASGEHDAARAAARLRSSATVETVIMAGIVLITAWLVAASVTL